MLHKSLVGICASLIWLNTCTMAKAVEVYSSETLENAWQDLPSESERARRQSQSPYAGASQGERRGNRTHKTNEGEGQVSRRTGPQSPLLHQTSTGMPFVGTFAAPANIALQNLGARNLPPTRLDSFVAESGFNDHIYGDEGTYGPPPYNSFERHNRIENGIMGARDAGLTTNHGSMLPAAWGKDEFIGGSEWSMSGPHGRTAPIPAPVQQPTPRPQPVENQNEQGEEQPSEPNPNDPNNLPPGYMGVYQHGVFLGSFDPNVDTFASYLQREHPMAYQTYLQQTGQH